MSGRQRAGRPAIGKIVVATIVVVVIAVAAYGALVFTSTPGPSSSTSSLPSVGSFHPTNATEVALAQKEGQLLIYWTPGTSTIIEPMKNFTKVFGIQVNVVGGKSGDQYQKALTEFQAGQLQADMIGLSGAYMNLLNKSGVLSDYRSPQLAAYPPALLQKGWVTEASDWFTIGYNTNAVSASTAPKSYASFLKPDPSWTRGYGWDDIGTYPADPVVSVFYTMWKNGILNDTVLSAIASHGVVKAASSIELTNRMGTGEFQVCVVCEVSSIAGAAQKGTPVDYVRLPQIYFIPYGVGIIKTAPHQNAAKLAIDYILSAEGQQEITNTGFTGVRPSVNLAGGGISFPTAPTLVPTVRLNQTQTTTFINHIKSIIP